MIRSIKKSYPKGVERAEKIFRDRGGVLRTGEALGAGIHPRTRYEMQRSGILEQLARGLYRLADLPPLGNPDLVAATDEASWFLRSLYVFGIVTASFAVYSLFRPIVSRLVELPQERARAAAILESYGKSTNDYFKVWTDKSYFFSPSKQSFISFRATGGVAFCLADPVGPDVDKEAATQAFLSFCAENGWMAVFMIPDDPAPYTRLGLSLLKIGEEGTIDLERFVSTTAKSKYFRKVQRRLEEDGYNFVRHKAPISESVVDEIQELSDRWLTLPHHREYGFLQGQFSRDYVKKSNICSLRDKKGTMRAFVNEVPSYKPGEATFDMMRHIPELHYGGMDYLFLKMMTILRDEGFQTWCRREGEARFSG